MKGVCAGPSANGSNPRCGVGGSGPLLEDDDGARYVDMVVEGLST